MIDRRTANRRCLILGLRVGPIMTEEIVVLSKLAASWSRVCRRPWTVTFLDELPGKNNTKTLAGVAVGALVGLLLSWGVHVFAGRAPGDFMGLASIWVSHGTPAPFADWTIVVPFGVIVGFYDFEIILFIFARLLGGRGSFGRQAYAQSLFYAPLAIVQQLVAATPVAARVIFAAAALWSLIPTTTSLKAVHGFSTARAVLTWVSPIVLNVVVVAVVVMALR